VCDPTDRIAAVGRARVAIVYCDGYSGLTGSVRAALLVTVARVAIATGRSHGQWGVDDASHRIAYVGRAGVVVVYDQWNARNTKPISIASLGAIAQVAIQAGRSGCSGRVHNAEDRIA
jgi:hypothetical protein